MRAFKVGHASGADWYQTSQACLAQIGDLPPGYDLGFLYVTDALSSQLADILAHFKAASGVEHWVGTVGMGICSNGQEYFDRPAIAVMMAEFADHSFRVFPAIKSGLEDFVRQHHNWYSNMSAGFAIVHADPRNSRIPLFVAELADTLPGGFLVGGLTSSRSSYVQIAQSVTEGGLSGVLFAGDVAVATGLTQGCSPIGGRHVISECHENIVIALDGRPAFEVFQEDAGDVIARDPRRSLAYIFAGLSVKGSDTGDYVVRHLTGFDAEQKLLAVGEMLSPGDTIMFCRRDADSAYKDMLRMLRDIKDRAPGTPRGGVYYSCVGRGPNLFGQNSEELRIIRQQLGDFPLVGFFCNGEVSHNRLYGYTGVLTLFL